MLYSEQQAFLLHSRPYQDHNYLVDLLTENDGKVSAVVYVSRNAKSNKKAFLQPFRPLTVLLKGRTQLKNLSQIDSSGKSLALQGNYLYSGFYLNELLIRLLTEQIPCSALFQQYQQSLCALVNEQPLELTLRNFELALLEELGVSFDFSPLYQAKAKKISHCYFSTEQGFIGIDKLHPLPKNQTCFIIEQLIAIAEQRLANKEVMLTYKILMRQVINNLLGNKPLNSRKFFKREAKL
jgi:DNA repair protein RecO (recombination protein O)